LHFCPGIADGRLGGINQFTDQFGGFPSPTPELVREAELRDVNFLGGGSVARQWTRSWFGQLHDRRFAQRFVESGGVFSSTVPL